MSRQSHYRRSGRATWLHEGEGVRVHSGLLLDRLAHCALLIGISAVTWLALSGF